MSHIYWSLEERVVVAGEGLTRASENAYQALVQIRTSLTRRIGVTGAKAYQFSGP